MKAFKYACPLMMLGFPALIFAADTLRQLNVKSKGMMHSQVIQRGIAAGTGCNLAADGASAVGSVYGWGEHFFRCVTIFDDSYHPVGTAWVEVGSDVAPQDGVVLQDAVALHQ